METARAKRILKLGIKSPAPADLGPMLATLVDEVFDSQDWLYEIKWDGYRSIVYCNGNTVALRSRNNKIFDEKYYPIHAAFASWKGKAVIDGEIVVITEDGISDFAALQNWRSEADGHIVFYAFDLLWYNGVNLMDVPLAGRRSLLKDILPVNDIIRLSENFDAQASEFFKLANEMGLEGIIAKKASSIYTPGSRSKDWLKIKTLKHQDVIIGGYTENENSPKLFSSLLLGVNEGKTLRYIGSVGTGFSNKSQEELMKKMKPLATKKCPFPDVPEYNKPSRFRPHPPRAEATWLKPVLVGEVSYREFTSDGILRHASFKGLREDKAAAAVKRETPKHTKEIIANESNGPAVFAQPRRKERATFLNPGDETQVRSIGGHDLKFTNLSKAYWPEGNITKRDMLNYYYQIAPVILPYLKGRPQSLNRFPNGINGESFYQKDVKGKAPGWVATFPYHSETDGRDKEFLVCNDEATLLYMAGLGCIELNPWSSRVEKPNNPDWCIIDLDPGEKTSFGQVIQAAQVTKQVLDAIGVTAYCKTSGSTGLHIYIPFGARHDYEASKEFARAIATLVHREIPKLTSIERLTKARGGKMYIDFLQNRPQATVAAPYSLRPKPYATVSMPLEWDEVKKGLTMKDFTINNAVARVRERGDLFKGVLGKGINLKQALQKIAALEK